MHNPNRALLFAGPVVGIDPGAVTTLFVTTLFVVVGTLVEVDVVDVVSTDELALEALARPNAEWVLAVEEA